MQVAVELSDRLFRRAFCPHIRGFDNSRHLVPPLVGESSFCLWLLVKGVISRSGKERVSMARGI